MPPQTDPPVPQTFDSALIVGIIAVTAYATWLFWHLIIKKNRTKKFFNDALSVFYLLAILIALYIWFYRT
jgi:hypothetical protein